ncbi:MAG: cell division protein ZapA [Tannerellaceae bacterium]|jgi:cell division protein ZapA|nr:cell division protein ZapA [Tannerellaceae bacterium]
MDEKKPLRIRIDIAGKSYHLWIDRKDEELMRKAARELEKGLERYRTKYPKDANEDDWVAMAALQLSFETLKQEEFIKEIEQMTNKPFEEYEYAEDKK